MKLFTQSQYEQLLRNGSMEKHGLDHMPVVKLFTPDAYATWLITEIDPQNPDTAYGLCDVGSDAPELNSIILSEIITRFAVERDDEFTATYPISVYEQAAQMTCVLTEEPTTLQLAEAILKSL